MRDSERVERKETQNYYQTPNTMIPLNQRKRGEIAQTALDELEHYREHARHWPVKEVFQDGRFMVICQKCLQALWFVKDSSGAEFNYTDAEELALKVAHIRQCHVKGSYDE
jgi:hypothetical protein